MSIFSSRSKEAKTIHIDFVELRSHFYVLIVGVMMPIMLIVIQKTEPKNKIFLSKSIMDGTRPVIEFLSFPVDVMFDFSFSYREYKKYKNILTAIVEDKKSLIAQKAELLLELNQLKKKHQVAEVSRYYNFTPVEIEIIDYASGNRSIAVAKINQTQDIHLKTNDLVINEKGLLGKVLEYNDSIVYIQLLNDESFRIPVCIDTEDNAYLLAGGGKRSSHLDFLHDDKPQLSEEQRMIYTCSFGDIFLPKVPVGVLEKNSLRVTYFNAKNKTNYASILHRQIDTKKDLITISQKFKKKS